MEPCGKPWRKTWRQHQLGLSQWIHECPIERYFTDITYILLNNVTFCVICRVAHLSQFFWIHQWFLKVQTPMRHTELSCTSFVESLARVIYHYTNEMMECGMMGGVLGSKAYQILVTQGARNRNASQRPWPHHTPTREEDKLTLLSLCPSIRRIISSGTFLGEHTRALRILLTGRKSPNPRKWGRRWGILHRTWTYNHENQY